MLNSAATGVLKKCNPDLPVFMSQLCDRIQAAFTGCRSILLYGDAAEGDFSQRFSTADVIAVCKLDLSTPEARQKAADIYAFAKDFPKSVGHLLNLYLVHRDSIADPAKRVAGFRVSKHGAHVLEKYPFSQVTTWRIRHKGVVLLGDDDRARFQEVDKGFAIAREFKHEFNDNIVRADFSKEPFNLPAAGQIDEDKFVGRCDWMCGALCSLLTESIPTKTGGLAWYNNRFGGLIQHFPDRIARLRNSYYELQDPQAFIRKLHPEFPRFLVHFVNQVCLHEGQRGDFNLKAIAPSYHGWDYMELESWLRDRFVHH
jgi:hypothetical protein